MVGHIEIAVGIGAESKNTLVAISQLRHQIVLIAVFAQLVAAIFDFYPLSCLIVARRTHIGRCWLSSVGIELE